MREAFAMQELIKFYQQKYWHIWNINVWNFNVLLTNDVVSFAQLGPDLIMSKICDSKSSYIQSTLVISTSVISNNRLSRGENLIPVLT